MEGGWFGAVRIACADLAFWFLDLIWANQSKAMKEPVPMLMSIATRGFCIRSDLEKALMAC